MSKSAAPLLILVLLAACGPFSPIEIKEAAVTAAAAGELATVTAILVNRQNQPDRLLGASSPAAPTVQLHQTTNTDSTMTMRTIPGLDLPPGTPVALEAAGNHLMLMGLTTALKPETSLELVLTFEKAGVQTLKVPVRATRP